MQEPSGPVIAAFVSRKPTLSRLWLGDMHAGAAGNRELDGGVTLYAVLMCGGMMPCYRRNQTGETDAWRRDARRAREPSGLTKIPPVKKWRCIDSKQYNVWGYKYRARTVLWGIRYPAHLFSIPNIPNVCSFRKVR